jgi:phage shock protein PspC (stress-responsive transcriptional regulator)
MEQNSNGQGPAGGVDPTPLRDVQSWRRSRSDRMVAGVCGGIARALDIDPVLVRVVMAVLVLSGPGLLFYVAAWVLMPDEGSDRSPVQSLLGDRIRPDHPWLWPIVIGICVFGAIAMMSSFNFGKLVPGPLVVLGLLWLFVFRRKGRRSHWHRGSRWSGRGMNWTGQPTNWSPGTNWTGQPPRPQDTPGAPGTEQGYSGPSSSPTGSPYSPTGSAYSPAGPPPPPPGPSSSAPQRPQDRTVEPVQPVWTEDDPLGLYVDEPAPAPVASTPAAPPVKCYRGVKPVVVLLTGIAIAIAAAAGTSTPLMLVIGLATLGLGMLVGGFLGRTLALLPLGILLALGVAVSMVFPAVPRDFIDTNFVAAPDTRITATSTPYKFDAGSLHLDLTKATFAPGAKVVVDGGAGEVVIKLPPNLDVAGVATTTTGEAIALGRHDEGHNATVTLNDLGADGRTGPSSVVLDLKLRLGSIKVERG